MNAWPRSRGRRAPGMGAALGVALLTALAAGGCGPRPAEEASESPPQAAEPAPERSGSRAVLFYLPSRIVDILDVVSLGVAVPWPPYLFPSAIHVNAHATRAIQVGAGSTQGLFLGKGYRRQLVWGLEQDEFSIGPLTVTKLEPFDAAAKRGSAYAVDRAGVLLPTDPPFAQGQMDYWAVGAHVGALVTAVSVDVHPLELLDAVLGFLFIDISGDDL